MAKKKSMYKNIIEHENEYPLDFSSFAEVTSVQESKFDRNAPLARTVEELRQRKSKYVFYVYQKNNTIEALPIHKFTFDSKEVADKAYKHYMRRWIDELIEPYRQKVARGKRLTLSEMDRCEEIQNMLAD